MNNPEGYMTPEECNDYCRQLDRERRWAMTLRLLPVVIVTVALLGVIALIVFGGR